MNETRTQQWVVAYDISMNKERSRVVKSLEGWGHRAQKSVFLVTTTRSGIHTLQRELNAHNITSGTILLLRLQASAQAISMGEPWQHPDAGAAYVF